MYNTIDNFINKFPVIKLLRALINIDTQNPPGNENNLIQFIENYFRQFEPPGEKYGIKKIVHSKERSSLVVTINGQNPNSLAFVGHVDSVPIGELEAWKNNPFEGVYCKGKVYGRGASDMKGGLTAMIIAALFSLSSLKPNRDVLFIFTADEELNSTGIREINSYALLSTCNEIIIPEPTENCLGVYEKGSMSIQLRAEGDQAHAGMPEKGINAIEWLFEFIHRLKQLCEPSTTNVYGDQLYISTTVFSGGISKNIIPPISTASLDIRTVNPQDNERIMDSIRELSSVIKEESGCCISWDIVQNRLPVNSSIDSSLVKSLENIYRKLSIPIKYLSIPYYTDIEEISRKRSIPFVIVGPGIPSEAHQIDEYIEIESILRAAKIYSLLIYSDRLTREIS